ncbi:MAG: DUF1275 domain-containing protein [Armatimonadetes bacterium]|nr:DUF1275 domain-containing protein [Armatimonadota bacterium]
MPIEYLSKLTSPERTERANRHLGISLAFVAGALNAGGFLAIGQYTSHMTGIMSSAADNIVLGKPALALAGFLALVSFLSGAATTAILVNYAKRNGQANIYSAPLFLEAGLLLVFGLVGATLQLHELVTVSLTAILLSFVMGLQNALVTKISNSEIRTTHVTGMITDMGIELGKLAYRNRKDPNRDLELVLANRQKLKIQISLVSAFFGGGLVGAWGFKTLGYSMTLPLALILILISTAPLFERSTSLE